MEGADREQQLRKQGKHACKVCRRSFPCGRSLGGHMRSHVRTSAPSAEESPTPPVLPQQLQRRSAPLTSRSGAGLSASAADYGLRKSPKKTWRTRELVCDGASTDQAKNCRHCGKGFPSWRALFGHMRCHSIGQRHPDERREEEETLADEENEEVEEKDSGDSWDGGTVGGAICLMMLSGDTSFCVPSDETAAFPGKIKGIDHSAMITGSPGVARKAEENSPSKKRKASVFDDGTDGNRDKGCHCGSVAATPRRKNRFECGACGKTFHSYQALGGHCAGHRKRHFAVITSDAGEICSVKHRCPQVRQLPNTHDLNVSV